MPGYPIRGGIVENWSRAGPLTPWVTLFTMGACALLTLAYWLIADPQRYALLFHLGFVPATINELLSLPWTQWLSTAIVSVFTAMFMHVSWVHLLGNMAFLLVFGVPVERRIGHLMFILVLVVGGGVTNAVVALRLPELATPIIGASGGVSVIIGTYLGLFPSGRIGLYLPLGVYLQFARLPALLVIGSWFTLQLAYTVFGNSDTQVAWWTHIAGFGIGLTTALLIRAVKRIRYH